MIHPKRKGKATTHLLWQHSDYHVNRYGNWTYFDDPVGATADLHATLEAYRNTYGRNIWLTEWSLLDFGNKTNNFAWNFPTYQQQVVFLKAAVQMLESLDYVERYAWFWL